MTGSRESHRFRLFENNMPITKMTQVVHFTRVILEIYPVTGKSNVEIFYVERIVFNKLSPRLDLVAH